MLNSILTQLFCLFLNTITPDRIPDGKGNATEFSETGLLWIFLILLAIVVFILIIVICRLSFRVSDLEDEIFQKKEKN